MKRAFLIFAMAACGGSTQHTKVAEVPIDQGGGGGSGTLPPDEMADSSIVTSSAAVPDGSAPPGVGPQSLDVQSDAGAASAPSGFVQRTGGLTQKECTDAVLVFAKLTSKESHQTAPTAADLSQHAIFGPMINECGQTTTKKQHKCAMAARTTTTWKKCME